MILAILSTFFSSKLSVTQDELRKNYLIKSTIYKEVSTKVKPYFEELKAQEKMLYEFTQKKDKDNAKITLDGINSIKENQIKPAFDNFYQNWDNFFPGSKIKFLVITDKEQNEVYSYSGREEKNKFKYRINSMVNDTSTNKMFRLTEYGFHNIKKDIKTVSVELVQDKKTIGYMFVGFPTIENRKNIYNDAII